MPVTVERGGRYKWKEYFEKDVIFILSFSYCSTDVASMRHRTQRKSISHKTVRPATLVRSKVHLFQCSVQLSDVLKKVFPLVCFKLLYRFCASEKQ